MTITKHQNSHPNVTALVEDLDSFGVRYVLIGSVATDLYGVEMQPGDMDIAPTLDHANLTRLTQVLTKIEAILPDTHDVIG